MIFHQLLTYTPPNYISLMYHMIRGQGIVKLYMVYNVLEYYQQEAAKLRVQIRTLQNNSRNLSRHMMGEGLSNLSMKDLKNLKTHLEKDISRIRAKKIRMTDTVFSCISSHSSSFNDSGFVSFNAFNAFNIPCCVSRSLTRRCQRPKLPVPLNRGTSNFATELIDNLALDTSCCDLSTSYFGNLERRQNVLWFCCTNLAARFSIYFGG